MDGTYAAARCAIVWQYHTQQPKGKHKHMSSEIISVKYNSALVTKEVNNLPYSTKSKISPKWTGHTTTIK